MIGVTVEDAINCGLGVQGDGAGRLDSEEAAVCWFVFSDMGRKGSKPGLDSEDSFSWTPHAGPMDSVYDDGEVLGVVIELSTILELEVPDADDDETIFPRLACSEGETSASDDKGEVFEFLSLVVKSSSEKHLL